VQCFAVCSRAIISGAPFLKQCPRALTHICVLINKEERTPNQTWPKVPNFSVPFKSPMPPTPTLPFYSTLFHLFLETSFGTAVATIVVLKSTIHVKCVEALMDAGSWLHLLMYVRLTVSLSCILSWKHTERDLLVLENVCCTNAYFFVPDQKIVFVLNRIHFQVISESNVANHSFWEYGVSNTWKRLLHQAQKAWCTRTKKIQALRRSCNTGMRSAQLCDCVLPPAGARRYEANHRGIEGEHWAQCARVRR